MEIKPQDTARVIEEIALGIKQLGNSSSLRNIVILANNLEEIIKDAKVISEISDKLDELFNIPVLVKEKRLYERRDGDYCVDLNSYLAGAFRASPTTA